MERADPAKRRRALALGIALLALFVALALIAIPWARTLYDQQARQALEEWIHSLGVWGFALVFLMQVLQVVVAIVPGEPFELIAGALYGGLGGLALCLLGCAAASALVFLLMRRFGTPLLEKLFRRSLLDRFSFLRDSKRLETVTFLLFLIPGTPKDMLTYVAGTTSIPMRRFLVLTLLARIPSVVSSTFIGDQLLAGKWYVALILTAATFALGILGIFFRERVMNFCRSHSPAARAGR